jgi:hypothetical protein
MAPLQKRAFFGLIFGIFWAIAMTLVFIFKGGAAAFDEDQVFRLTMDAIWVGGLVVYLVMFQTILRNTNKVDERDRLIYERSPRIQWIAVVLTLAAWVIGLSEVFNGQGIPSIYLYLMFFTVLCVSAIAGSIGILLGYLRIDRNG